MESYTSSSDWDEQYSSFLHKTAALGDQKALAVDDSS